jgi:radical SAM-linked protein
LRLRFTFSKSGALRYTGHLDLQTIWERTIRRAGLPLAYTQGFHPGPRLQIASALPLGFIGHAEIVDVWLQEGTGADPCEGLEGEGQGLAYKELLQPVAPAGLVIVSVEEVDEHSPALQTCVDSAEYEVSLLDLVDKAALAERLAALLKSTSLLRERRSKQYDLRPLIESVELQPADGRGPVCLKMRLAVREGATGRPEEVLAALAIPLETARIERTRLIFKTDLK